jgi:DNA-directed RNA polymerase sigma subunit (sigma70/sigma32)
VTDRDPLTAPIRSCHEVGRILGISKNAVIQTEKRALAKIRAALEQDFAERKARDERAEMNEG